jgi:FMN-dependent NADH-azoreductase
VGLLGVERAVIVTSSGGTPIGSDMDFGSRYLEHICRFIGITDVFHIDASGSKRSPEQVIAQGKQQVDSYIASLANNRMSGVE